MLSKTLNYLCIKHTKMADYSNYIKNNREDFLKGELLESIVNPDPCEQFKIWMDNALKSQAVEAIAFNLATVDLEGKPSNRIVYLREYFDNQFVFYTNYLSRKGANIKVNPNVSMCFFWPELEQQIRIEGVIEKYSTEKSDEYFNSRPEESKIGAWSSPQSQVIKSRDELEENIKNNTEKFKGQEIKRPENWGGYLIKANYYEFWQGRKSRLHDRLTYTKEANNWVLKRIAP